MLSLSQRRQFRNRAGRLMELSPAFDLDYFGRTALLTFLRKLFKALVALIRRVFRIAVVICVTA